MIFEVMMNATIAREQAGMTIEQAAKKARVGVRYLASLEKRGGFSFVLASRLTKVYGCRIDNFLM